MFGRACKNNRNDMEENTRGSRLLALSNEVLFNHGGCHVFALALSDRFGYPLLLVTGTSPSYYHLHIACNPSDGWLLDYFG